MRENKRCVGEASAGRRSSQTSEWKVRAGWRAAAWLAPGLLLGSATLPSAGAEPPRIPIAVLDFDYLDTSGEARDQSAYHTARLKEFALALRADLERSQRFQVVSLTCQPDPCSITASEPAELVAAARRSGARLLLFGGIHKQSTLVQWAKAQVVDVRTEQLVFDRLLSFRGDDEAAWRHAETFLVKDILAHSWPP